MNRPRWCTSCNSPCAHCFRGTDRGATLLNLTGESAIPKPKHTMLPILVVLFLISYGLMATLVVEQGRTIDSQRTLIHELFDDSAQLSALKGRASQAQHAGAQAKAQAQAQASQAAPPDSRGRAPLSQATPGTKNGHGTGKLRRQAPQKPPQVTSDDADERRTLLSI
jgi:hypothetical protein